MPFRPQHKPKRAPDDGVTESHQTDDRVPRSPFGKPSSIDETDERHPEVFDEK